MTEPFDRFDSVRVPDQWDDIVARAEDFEPSPARRGPRPLVLLGAVAAVVALVAGLVVVTGSSGSPADDATTGAEPGNDDVTAPNASQPQSTDPSAASSGPTTAVTATTTATIPAAPVTRPVFPDEICPPLSARESTVDGIFFFDFPSSEPTVVQVIATEGSSEADPFALLLRYPDGGGPRPRSSGGETVDVGGADVWVASYDNGNGEAIWTLEDGSTGYLRSRGLQRADLIEIVTALEPAASPTGPDGFTIDPAATGFRSLHEAVDDQLEGTIRRSECDAGGLNYELTAVDGDPVLRYGSVLDGPIPIAVAAGDDWTAFTRGPTGSGAPTLDGIVDADSDRWATLLVQPDASARAATELSATIGNGRVVTLPMTDVATGEFVGTYRLRLYVANGATVLEYEGIDLLTDDGIEYDVIELDGRRRGKSTYAPGSLSGSRVSDDVRTEPFSVRISHTDATDNVLQTSDVVLLIPEL